MIMRLELERVWQEVVWHISDSVPIIRLKGQKNLLDAF
jgi:hypothetical protein